MNNIYKSFTALFALVSFASCGEVAPDVDGIDRKIEISAGVSGMTKALLNSGDLDTGSQICLYDILGDDAGYIAHIEGQTATSDGSSWDIDGAPYSWLHDGNLYDHSFFGWLTRDKDGLDYTGVFKNGTLPVETNVTDQGNGIVTWSVGEVPMMFNYHQFDFCYSNIVSRKVDNPDYSIVNLQLNHLFTSFGIKFHNYDSAPVRINSIKIFGLTNNKSAQIEFNTNTGVVTPGYNPAATQTRNNIGEALELLAAPIDVDPDGEIKNVITCSHAGGLSKDADAFFLMWPQTRYELPNCKLAVKLEGMSDYVVLSMKPAGAPADYSFDAGTKHHIELASRGKKIDLKVAPAQWDGQDMTLDDSQGIVCNDAFKLKFIPTSCTIDDTEKKIYFIGGRPIKMSFKLEQPTDATWQVSFEGDFDAFEIDNAGEDGLDVNYGDGINTPSGSIDGSVSWVTIYPRNLDPDRDYQGKISITVRTSTGRLLMDDEQVLGKYKDYTIVQQAS